MKFTYTADAKPVEGYTIRRGIHRGGFGEVYYAVSDAGKEVALKLLTHDLDTELRGVRQCLNLKHPNLITTFDVRTDADGDHWVIMEYIQGASLEDVLHSFPHGLPDPEIGAWMRGLLDGVEFLHDRGIVHRDLKPANVYRENGHVKIGDVGLSKQMGAGRRNQHTEAVGTIYYMAPEVAKGQYGPEVDVYSLGVMLYEMVTGRLPFEGETTAEILMKHLSTRPDLSLLPTKLRPIIAHALEKDPAKRTPTIAAFRRELQGFTGAEVLPESAFADPLSVTPVTTNGDTARKFVEARRARFREPDHQRKSSRSEPTPQGQKYLWILIAAVLFIIFTRSALGGQWPMIYIVAFWLGIIIGVRFLFDPGKHGIKKTNRLPVPSPVSSIARWSPWERWSVATLTAAVASTAMTLGGIFVTTSLMDEPIGSTPNVLYSILVSMMATTALVSARSATENQRWSQGKYVVLGAITGAVAWGLQQFLEIRLNGIRGSSHDFGPIDLWVQGEPTLALYMGYFSLMMLVQSWSSTLDPRRESRLMLGPVVWAAGYGWVSTFVLGLPVVESIVWSGAINAAAQLASPWQSPKTLSA